ncbi:DUF4236 domain-containing protein [Vitellibacter sp. q18]|nr:DUF4236 domain-containing protein [Aequorivita lutea]
MGFRYQKKINLGKGFGLNISKSAVSPSLRTKRGSLSSKGYSIRSGIPGVTYRKTFSTNKNDGCLSVFTFLVFLIFFIIIIKYNPQSLN